MQEIYFDNSSTTRVCDQALAEAVKEMQQEYGNPGSVHHLGAQAFHALQAAHTSLASALHALPEEIYFTGSGTEANNMLIFGVAEARARAGRRILVSAVEHPSVSEPAKYLLSRGFDVHFIPVDPQGRIRLDALAELLNEETILVSIMHVNNETGTIQPLAEAGSLIRRLAPQAIFHVDGVQSFGRVAVDLAAWQADAFVASGHKIHAPKGIALLWLKKERRIPPLLRGGGQERGMRSGTENMPGICAFAKASEIACAGIAGCRIRIITGCICQWATIGGGCAAYPQSFFSRCAQRSTAALSGGKRRICICWICLQFTQQQGQPGD